MKPTDAQLRRGRDAFERRSWSEAAHALDVASRETGLAGADLWRLAVASYLIGAEDKFVEALQAAHQASVGEGHPETAVRCAFWIGLHLAERGDMAQATGWFGRAGRIVDEMSGECVERGYLLVPAFQQKFGSGDDRGAESIAREVVATAQRHGDAELLALALHLQGRAVLRQGRVGEGLALLDEAMVAVTADDLSPVLTGLIYCSVIGACREVWALDRARRWTAALDRWCGAQPDMVAYRGACRVYQAEILSLRGAWEDALSEALRAADDLGKGPAAVAQGMAYYAAGEVHRHRGEYAAAEEAYRAASRGGYEPQPGLALLRLGQGDAAAASAAIQRALGETRRTLKRAALLPAATRIALRMDDLDEAEAKCAELEALADAYPTDALEALAAETRGAVDLERGDPTSALTALKSALETWRRMNAPYEVARVRVLRGRACRALGDHDGAALELDAAQAAFEELRAAPALRELEAATGRGRARDPHGLTPREREVLALVATGRTNRAVAERLFISEKTVARHVANIFRKLGVSSRSAATAYAYQHDLADP